MEIDWVNKDQTRQLTLSACFNTYHYLCIDVVLEVLNG